MVRTWLTFAFDCHSGREASGSSLINLPQDSRMLSSFQRADSESCGWMSACHNPASVQLTTEDHCNMLTYQPELWRYGWGPAAYSVHPGLSQVSEWARSEAPFLTVGQEVNSRVYQRGQVSVGRTEKWNNQDGAEPTYSHFEGFGKHPA